MNGAATQVPVNSQRRPITPISGGDGYTFLELLVVISLVGIFLFFAVPRIAPDIPSEDFRKTINWFMLNIPRLKRLAVSEQKTFLLAIDRTEGTLWVSTAASLMDEPGNPPETRFTLPNTVRIKEVISFGRALPESGPVMIRFSPDGTSDFIQIRILNDNGREADILIEPFLYAAKISENRP